MAKTMEEREEAAQLIAEEISSISEGVKKLLNSRLNKQAITILVSAASGIKNKKTITKILDAVSNLDKTFLTEKI